MPHWTFYKLLGVHPLCIEPLPEQMLTFESSVYQVLHISFVLFYSVCQSSFQLLYDWINELIELRKNQKLSFCPTRKEGTSFQPCSPLVSSRMFPYLILLLRYVVHGSNLLTSVPMIRSKNIKRIGSIEDVNECKTYMTLDLYWSSHKSLRSITQKA